MNPDNESERGYPVEPVHQVNVFLVVQHLAVEVGGVKAAWLQQRLVNFHSFRSPIFI